VVFLIYLLLAAGALVAFLRVNQCDFINFDDPSYVTTNAHVKAGITSESIKWAFTTGHSANWHPLTWMSHMLDVQLFGLNARWHHLTNLLFHIVNTVLLFFVFNRMTKEVWKSAFVAALFAVHPLHVESVAWVAERKDVLSTFFWMLTTAAYIHYVDRPRLKNYLLVILLFAMGLMAKPMLVTLPFVLLLLDYWPLQRLQGAAGRKQEAWSENQNPGPELKPLSSNKRKTKSGKRNTGQKSSQSSVASTTSSNFTTKSASTGPETLRPQSLFPLILVKLPLFALAALSCIVTFVVQQKGGAVRSAELYPFGTRIANALVAYMIYIEKTIWPGNLAVFYPHPGLRPFGQVLGAALALIAVTSIVIRSAKKFPYLALGWLWFTGTLVPVIGIVQVGVQSMADRYTYIPLIGLFVIVAWGVPELLEKWRYRKAALFASSALVLSCFLILTWTQVGYWRNGLALYDHALKVLGPNDVIYCNRGAAYADLGNKEQAISEYGRAVEMNPRNAEAHNGLGFVYLKLGNYHQAVSEETKAIEVNFEYADAYGNRGLSYYKLGDYNQAVSDFSRVIEIDPELAWAYAGRGKAYGELGNYRQAISDFDRTIEIDPKFTEAYNNRGVAYGMIGNNRQAISDYDKAIEIDPGYADAYYNRGVAYSGLGSYTQAISDFDRAVEINPEYADAYNNRGAVYGKLGNRRQAIEDLQEAARLGSEDAKNSLRSVGTSW
jgi:tetratricopeptide (TPR) repeat protein